MANPQQNDVFPSSLAMTIWKPGAALGICDLDASGYVVVRAFNAEHQEHLAGLIAYQWRNYQRAATKNHLTTTAAAFVEDLSLLLRGNRFVTRTVPRSLVLPIADLPPFDRTQIRKRSRQARSYQK